MLYNNVNIESFGYETPPEIISSSEIEKILEDLYLRLKLPAGRLELMTGIKERRLWKPGTMPSDAAAMAGEKALAASGLKKEKIGCLLMCSVSRDFLEPASATVVHNLLGLPENCMVFDISNACLGILTGMITLANMIELGQVQAGLLVSGENSRPLLESTLKELVENKELGRQSIKPYFASLTIGSGSVAIVMTDRKISKSPLELRGGVTLAATKFNNLCRGNTDKGMTGGKAETMMQTDSEELLLRGVDTAVETWGHFKKELGWDENTINCVCTHQVGAAHRKLLYEKLEIDMKKDFSTFAEMGNAGSVSCPLTAAMAIERGLLNKGGRLAMLGIGSGINCTMLGIQKK